MAAPKGNNYSKGRTKGSTNKVTKEVREAYKDFVEGNLGKLQLWLEECDPKDRLEFMIKFSEYFIPKLARTEMTGKDGKEFSVGFTDEQAAKILEQIRKKQ